MSIARFLIWVLLLLFACFPLRARGDDTPPEPAPEPAPAPAPEAAPAPGPAPATVAADRCLKFADDGPVTDSVAALKFAVGDAAQPIVETRVLGLSAVSPERLWELLGARPSGVLGVEQAAALIARLAQSGLFARITPTVRMSPGGGGAVLEIALVENPTVRAIEIRGLFELTREEILDELLDAPDRDHDDHDHGLAIRIAKHVRIRITDSQLALRCGAPVPPLDWLAHHQHGEVHGGLVWRGLAKGLERVQRFLRREGYLLAEVSASLSADGTLAIAIDEGRLDWVDIQGVHPSIRPDVWHLLGVAPGAVLNLQDLRHGVDRVRARYPFLRTVERRHPAPASLSIVETDGPDGARQYTLSRGVPRCDRDDDWYSFDDDDDDHDHEHERACAFASAWFFLDGHRLTVHLDAERGDLDTDATELVRHTPVSGFAPGMLFRARAWDPADRAHFRLDTLFNLNTRRAAVATPHGGTIHHFVDNGRIDLMVSPSLAVPRMNLAELGAAAYAITDTDDNWRVTRLDAYLNSALFGRGGRDYYRRTGASAFATFHWLDSLTIGGEYRYDRYDSLATVSDPDTIFGDYIQMTPQIDEGIAGSLVLRAEWASESRGMYDVDPIRDRRPSQGSIVDRNLRRGASGLHTVATLELAKPELGGTFHYWRATSDSVLYLATGREHGVSLRVRVGGGRDLPLQRQEALGGWGSVRGYDYKEFGGGDASALANLEYRFDPLSLFVDGGTIRQTGEWTSPRVGVGTALNLGDSGQLAFAWRTDDQAHASPEIRLLFERQW